MMNCCKCMKTTTQLFCSCSPELGVCDGITQTPYVEGGDSFVLRWVQPGHGRGSLQQFISYWIIDAIVTVLNVLICQWIIRICGFLVPDEDTKNMENS